VALAISLKTTLAKERRESNYLREVDLENYLDALCVAGVTE